MSFKYLIHEVIHQFCFHCFWSDINPFIEIRNGFEFICWYSSEYPVSNPRLTLDIVQVMLNLIQLLYPCIFKNVNQNYKLSRNVNNNCYYVILFWFNFQEKYNDDETRVNCNYLEKSHRNQIPLWYDWLSKTD